MRHAPLSMHLQSRAYGWAVCVGFVCAAFLLLMARGLLDHAPHYDELFHVLAARGMLQSGKPVIADGIYDRSELFTSAVAWSYRYFGDSLMAARLPSLAFGAVLVFVSGFWLVRRAGLVAGAAGAGLLCIVPATVDLSVFARFYTMHALLMAAMFVALFEAMQPERSLWVRIALFVIAVALVPLGYQSQEITVIAFGAGVAGVLALFMLDRWTLVKSIVARHAVLVILVLALALAAAFLVSREVGLWYKFTYTSLWAAGNVGRFQYYLVEFRRELPLLWPLLPLAAALTIANPAYRRLAVFCTVSMVVALVAHSIAAQKSARYVYYVVPLACVLWACALASLTAPPAEMTGRMGGRGGALGAGVKLALVCVGLLFSQEGARAVNLAAGRFAHMDSLPFQSEPDWRPLVAELEPRARSADRVVTSNSMKALYYLGRYDYELNATIVPETTTKKDFGVDRRTGRRAIGQARSIAQVLDQPGTTFVVLESDKIGRPSGVTAEAFAEVESRCSEIALPSGYGVRAWSCGSAP